MRRFLFALAAFSGVLWSSALPVAHAQDQAALSGLSEVKVGFDITTGDAAALRGAERLDETGDTIAQRRDRIDDVEIAIPVLRVRPLGDREGKHVIGSLVQALERQRVLRLEGIGHAEIVESRAVGIVAASLVVFGISIERLGLVASIFLLVGLGALATRGLRPVETLSVALVLIVLTWAIFILGLGLTIPVWPEP